VISYLRGVRGWRYWQRFLPETMRARHPFVRAACTARILVLICRDVRTPRRLVYLELDRQTGIMLQAPCCPEHP